MSYIRHKIQQVFKDGDKLSGATVARRMGNVNHRQAMAMCYAAIKKNKLRKVYPAEVGWNDNHTKSNFFMKN